MEQMLSPHSSLLTKRKKEKSNTGFYSIVNVYEKKSGPHWSIMAEPSLHSHS